MRDKIERLGEELQTIITGQEDVIHQLLTALLAGGHVLLQGVPGVGKTKLARTLTQLITGQFRRIQFTPDLMPSDILGNALFDFREGTFQVHEGPIFGNVVLADEINRTPPKTQAALLEAMEERQVSVFGDTRALPSPFFVIATQNPIEYEGTYPLPEAQLDRFLMLIRMEYPALEAEVQMLRHRRELVDEKEIGLKPVLTADELHQAIAEVRSVTVSDPVAEYIVRLIRASRELPSVLLGASPRAATALMDVARAVAYLEGRAYVIPDDVLEIAVPVLRHRILLNPNAELEGVGTDVVVGQIVQSVAAPH